MISQNNQCKARIFVSPPTLYFAKDYGNYVKQCPNRNNGDLYCADHINGNWESIKNMKVKDDK